jgi:hypothetical protein
MYQAFQDLRQAGLLADYPPGATEPDLTRDELGQAVARYGRTVTQPGAEPTPLNTAQARRVWRLINSLRQELRAAGFTDFDGVKQHLLSRALPPDVPPDHWAAQEVAELFAEGILEGYPGGTFEKPEAKAEARSDEKADQRQRGRRFTDIPFDTW